MMSQVPPVSAAVTVPVSPVVGNLYILVDRASIVVDELDEEDSL